VSRRGDRRDVYKRSGGLWTTTNKSPVSRGVSTSPIEQGKGKKTGGAEKRRSSPNIEKHDCAKGFGQKTWGRQRGDPHTKSRGTRLTAARVGGGPSKRQPNYWKWSFRRLSHRGEEWRNWGPPQKGNATHVTRPRRAGLRNKLKKPHMYPG